MGLKEDEHLFGRLVVRNRLATQDQVDECMAIQARLEEQGHLEKLGDLMISKAYLTENQLRLILRSQQQIAGGSGQRIPGYEIVEKLGQGSMGSVYRARQISMDRPVAIKVLSQHYSRNKEFVNRFFREARAAARLSHPHIVRAIDVGNVRDLYYFVMEYVDGSTVQERLRQHKAFTEAECLEVGRQVSQALHHAHSQGIIHRDIKPDNILVGADGLAKLCDLGLARGSGKEDAVPDHGTPAGTPHYMSCEQARGEKDLDARTDIYSLGATLYHMLTGRVPFEGTSSAVIMVKLITDDLVSPRELNPGISASTSAMIEKMMAKKPEERYASASELEEDIVAVQDGQIPDHVGEIAESPTLKTVNIRRGARSRRTGSRSRLRRGSSSRRRKSGASKDTTRRTPGMPTPIARLQFLSGEDEGKTFEVFRPVTIVGRLPECDIQVADTWFSRKHFAIYAREGRFEIEDLKSMNGTRKNGAHVTRSRLRFGDQIAVFDTLIRFDAPE